MPTGCQTVLVSRKASKRCTPGAAAQSSGRPSRSGREHPLHVPGREPFQVRPVRRGRAGQVDRVDVLVRGQHRGQFPQPPGQHVDHAARHIRGGQHLGQADRGQHRRAADGQHGRVAGGDDRREHADQAEQSGLRWREHRHDPGRLGHAEVEVRARHRVGAPGDLRDLVRPARIPDPPVDSRRHVPGRASPVILFLSNDNLAGELLRPAFEHFGDPVQDLAAVVGRRPGPAGEGLAGRDHGVPGVFA